MFRRSVSLCCAVPNARWVEYIPQLDSLTAKTMAIRDGFAHPSTEPGLGIDWNWDAIGHARRNGSERTIVA